jgi:hypothetical protein
MRVRRYISGTSHNARGGPQLLKATSRRPYQGSGQTPKFYPPEMPSISIGQGQR